MTFKHAEFALGARHDDHMHIFGAFKLGWRHEFEMEGHF